MERLLAKVASSLELQMEVIIGSRGQPGQLFSFVAFLLPRQKTERLWVKAVPFSEQQTAEIRGVLNQAVPRILFLEFLLQTQTQELL
jgi:hypothetical protein